MSVQAKAAMWFFICSIIQRGISFITTPVFTRLMSTSDYGQYNTFVSWQSVISVIVTLNLTSGVYLQGLVKFEKDRDRFTSALFGLLCGLIVVWMLIYLAFRNHINVLINMNTEKMLLMFCLIWSSALYGFWSVNKRVDFDYKSIVLISLLFSVANPVLSILFMSNSEDKALAKIIGMAISEFILFGWMAVSLLRKSKKVFSGEYWAYAMRFNMPLIPHYLASSILSSSDRIMIERLIGESEAGIYSLAYSVSMIMTMISGALTQTIEPWVYKKIRDQKEETIAPVAYSSLIAVAGVNLLLIAFAPEVIRIFAPRDYYDAIWTIPPVVMSVFFMFGYSFFAAFEFYYEKTKYISLATFGGAILNIVFNLLFIPRFGYVAAGYTTLTCYVVYVAAHYCFMKRILSDQEIGKRIYSIKVMMFIAGVFMIAGFLFSLTYEIWQLRYLLLLLLVFMCVYKKKKIAAFIEKILAMRTAEQNESD